MNLRAIADATDNLDGVLSNNATVADYDGIGQHLTCAEADALAALLEALGMLTHATDLRTQHALHDDDDDDADHVQLRDRVTAETRAHDARVAALRAADHEHSFFTTLPDAVCVTSTDCQVTVAALRAVQA